MAPAILLISFMSSLRAYNGGVRRFEHTLLAEGSVRQALTEVLRPPPLPRPLYSVLAYIKALFFFVELQIG